MIRIAIADKDFLTKEGLKHILASRSDVEIIGEVCTNTELKALFRHQQPDVLIMDFDQPGAFSLQDLVYIKRKYTALKILVISNNRHKHDILSAMEFGIDSYLLKECGEDEIFEAIYATSKGEQFFCAQVLENILGQKSLAGCDGLFLTKREVEVVKLVAGGYSTAEIAAMFCRSVHTINTHRKNIMQKLGLSNPSELVLYALKRGLVAA